MVPLSRKRVEHEIAAWLRTDPAIRPVVGSLVEAFPTARHILLVGGVLRDYLLRPGAAPKDVDVIVDGISVETLGIGLSHTRRNFYGGLNFKFAASAVDVWTLAETYHIREFGLAPTIPDFLAGAPFNMDKVAFDVRIERLFEDGFLKGLNERVIAYAPRNPYLEHVQAARCVLLRHKTGFRIDESARALLARVAESMQRSDELVLQVHDFLRDTHGIEDHAVRRDIVNEITSG